MDRLKSFFKEVSSRWSYRHVLQREGVSSSLVILLRVNIGARALTIDLTWKFLFCDHLAKYYKSLYGNTYDRLFLGIKNTVKFWIRNTSPHFHSASLSIWPLHVEKNLFWRVIPLFCKHWRVLVYKTDERKWKLAKAVYLGPDDDDANSNDNQKKDGTFRWPKQRDTDIVSHRYIFTHARVQKVGNCFVVSYLESIDHKCKTYQEIYINAVT